MDRMEKIVSLCKRRGFIFPSSEIYGGLNGCWDYGPLGVELKRNVREAWWRDCVTSHDESNHLPGAPGQFAMVGLDCSILMNPRVWEASGHVGGFSDPMVDCSESKKRYRADQLDLLLLAPDADTAAGPGATVPHFAFMSGDDEGKAVAQKKLDKALKVKKGETSATIVKPLMELINSERARIQGPDATQPGTLTEPRSFNLMFKTFVGAMEDSASVAYLRPETAQGIFANFKNVCETSRVRIPFGIAQIGKAFRNEINPRNFTFRSREFEQMEIEFFCHPSESAAWYEYWRHRRYQWYLNLGISGNHLHLREHAADELAHYASGCSDVEYDFPFGCSELEGIANRGDFDLRQHAQFSGKDLRFFDDQEPDKEKQRYLPYVVEPSAGADRGTLAFLCEAFDEDVVENETRTVLRFHPRLAPIKAAIFPLVKKDGLGEKALEVYRQLKPHLTVTFDDKGAIGRRYRRQDEAGTPFCITIDNDTMQDQTVTLRDRDTLGQERVAIADLVPLLRERLAK